MTLYYADPEAGANIPVKTRTVSGEQVPGHDVLALPGTVEADIGDSKAAMEALAAAVTANRVAVDLATTPTANLAAMAAGLAPASAIYSGNKNVTTAGIALALASSQALTRGVRVRAKDANTGLIYIGGASVTTGSDRLTAGESIWIDANNLALVYIDAAVSGEGVTFSGW